LSGLAVLGLLLLDTVEAGVIGAVVVAGEEIAVLLAQAGVVVCGAVVDLRLFGANASVEDAEEMLVLVRRERWSRKNGS
jgi:hypothetical protein